MSVATEKLRRELEGYLKEREVLNEVIAETRAELRKAEKRDRG